MRNIVLILVAANLGIAAWFWRTAESPDSTVERVRDDAVLPPIVLVSESSDEESQSVAAGPDYEELQQPDVQFAIPEPTPMCFSVGPFSSVEQYEAAVGILLESDLEPDQRAEEGEIWLGHWLYLPNVTNQAQADELSARLTSAGFEDTYFDPTGVDGDVLSLGLFREFARAEALRDRYIDAGFRPELVDRTRPGTIYWADLIVDEAINPDLAQMQTPGRIVRLESRVCDDPESASG
ncbi:MAG: SPOR domain-containing protein [Gammaproteobacteria bacterium]